MMLFTDHDDGRVTVDAWDSEAIVTRESIDMAHPCLLRLDGDRLTIAVANGRAVYEMTYGDNEVWRGLLVESCIQEG